MLKKQYSDVSKKLMLSFQKDELTSYHIYSFISEMVKDEKNSQVLKQIADDEHSHANVWKQYTNEEIKPSYLKIIWYRFLFFILGYTFVIKSLELHEFEGIQALDNLKKEIPEVKKIIKQEKEHEKQLINMLDEERLNYVGAMVLGLNDALVELTGTIAGMTFVLMNTTLIAMAGIITGVSATLSMAASNCLAERAEGNPNALKASIYTGLTYLLTVIFLVFPYLIMPTDMYLPALLCMIATVVFLVFIFNYYIAVVKSEPFWSKFMEMTAVSLSVALIAFLLGLGAKMLFGIEIG